jgi:tungstate transport system substrate-binding protein
MVRTMRWDWAQRCTRTQARGRRVSIATVAAAALISGACSHNSKAQQPTQDLILATTTSTQDSGLLGVLLPLFETTHAIRVKQIAVGTGEALQMGARGDADVLLVHSRRDEDDFMARGLGSLRLDVMHNDFVLVGPNADPAHVRGQSVLSALAGVAQTHSLFVSRGDGSGTSQKERELWGAAGMQPQGKPWHLSTGQGMAETLRVASEKQAYTLVDRGTWLPLRASLQLVIVCEADERLRNPYGVIVVNAKEFPAVHAQAAETFARWLVSRQAQEQIGNFGVERFGQALFVPDARPGGGP